MLSRLIQLLLLLTTLQVSAGVKPVYFAHDSEKATEATASFIRTLFIENHPKLAYEKTHDNFKKAISYPAFLALSESVDKSNEVYEITHTRMIYGADIIEVYCKQESEGNDTLYFLFTMTGSTPNGYKLSGVRYASRPVIPVELSNPVIIY
ncbi:hypothetical protein VV869_05215 [Photobacterium sp. MCCC 1A19761]|uniref:hypothetical protein n=1 Tax=Photobacterium sp. MCCC 1A19761 TaxID=3115000 RepID=UPI00307EAED3